MIQATKDKTISKLEKQLFALKKKLAAARHKTGQGLVEDCKLSNSDGSTVRLSELFANKNELIVIFNMGSECPYCTLWGDGFNGMLAHLENRAAVVVVSPDDPETQRKFARSRGWKFRMVSHQGTSFRKDMGFESKKGDPWPGAATFQKDKKGRILHVASAGFGPGDDYCSAWSLFDLLPGGAKGWNPKFHYGGYSVADGELLKPELANI